jgi:hypothetical protein
MALIFVSKPVSHRQRLGLVGTRWPNLKPPSATSHHKPIPLRLGWEINYSFDCDGSWQKIHVPCNYLRTDYLQYIEGQILTIHYPDSSTISILCGSNMDIGITDNKTKGLHYKKVIIKGYQLIYEDVPRQKLRLFNNAFELLNRDIK